VTIWRTVGQEYLRIENDECGETKREYFVWDKVYRIENEFKMEFSIYFGYQSEG
jgi:hypothetical protein